MIYVLVKHNVRNYNKWRKTFNELYEYRKSNGELQFQIFRNNKSSNEVIGLFKWDSLKNAKKFMSSKELKEKMKEAGVSEKPLIYFLNKV